MEYNISREDQDKFAIDSQGKAKKAIRSGVFKKEIVPVQLKKGVFEPCNASIVIALAKSRILK